VAVVVGKAAQIAEELWISVACLLSGVDQGVKSTSRPLKFGSAGGDVGIRHAE